MRKIPRAWSCRVPGFTCWDRGRGCWGVSVPSAPPSWCSQCAFSLDAAATAGAGRSSTSLTQRPLRAALRAPSEPYLPSQLPSYLTALLSPPSRHHLPSQPFSPLSRHHLPSQFPLQPHLLQSPLTTLLSLPSQPHSSLITTPSPHSLIFTIALPSQLLSLSPHEPHSTPTTPLTAPSLPFSLTEHSPL